MKKLAIVIGRFQPLHKGHMHLISEAAKQAEHVLVIIGGANNSRTPKNPWTYEERYNMFDAVYNVKQSKTLHVVGVQDYLYSDSDWCEDIQQTVNNHMKRFLIRNGKNEYGFSDKKKPEDKDIIIVGHIKDDSSYYLNMFPQWGVYEAGGTVHDNNKVINATDIRADYFEMNIDGYDDRVPESVNDIMETWGMLNGCKPVHSPEFRNIMEEHEQLKEYKKLWEAAPFPSTFVTADAVVLCGNHILLVKRKFSPGKGKWALPGGFVNQNEMIENTAIRELKEETKIRLHKNILRGSIKGSRVFDAPERSLRGRTITHAYLIVLSAYNGLPEVKGSDDAEHAKWVPLHEFYGMESELFEDHFHISTKMIGLT